MRAGKYVFMAGDLCKVLHISPAHDQIVFYNFNDNSEKIGSLQGALLIAQPALKIGEVGKMLDRKPDTIRKWEQKEWIPEARQWDIGIDGKKKIVRFYSPKDVETIRDLVSSVHQGRPRKDKRVTNSLPSEGNLKILIRERVKQINAE